MSMVQYIYIDISIQNTFQIQTMFVNPLFAMYETLNS